MWNFIKNYLIAVAKTLGTVLIFTLVYFGICWFEDEQPCDLCLALILAIGAIYIHYDKN